MDRKSFLKSVIGTSLLASPLNSFSKGNDWLLKAMDDIAVPLSGSMISHKTAPIPKVKIGLIGLGNRGKTLTKMLTYMIENGTAEIVAISDLLDSNADKILGLLEGVQTKMPTKYCKDESDWKKIAQRDDVDLLLICTPWELHTPMSIYGMEQGKHVASEVPIAYTLKDCYDLVKTSEETKKHCIMLENCCYNDEELFLLNMIQEGVFGDVTHAEGAYLHDLRAHLLSEDYYVNQWRIKHHLNRDGNLYTTHGLGPISMYMQIGRGDIFDHLTSMSSRELSLSETAKLKNAPYQKIKCGDMNTTMIKTKKGKSIMLQFDVHTGRPYSRINKVVGTKAVHDGYPSQLYFDDANDLKYWGHKWVSDEVYQEYKGKYKHPMVVKLEKIAKQYKEGHGGMDFIMMYRLITCLNQGLTLDLNVYDGVLWSAITPLSEVSVAQKSSSVDVPDFTGGAWEKNAELEIMRELSKK